MDNTQTYQDDPLYFQAMECFQRGEWKNGLKYLSELMEIHTLEPELRSLNNEMQLRAHVDHDEVQDEQTLRRQRNRNWAARLGILFLVVLFVAISVRAYAGWIQSQFNTARLVVEEQAQQVELAVLYNNAQSLLAASRPQEANEILNQIEAAAPDFPYLPELRTRTDALLLLDEKYNQGVKLQAGGDFMSALVIFDDLQTQNPGYKDVESRLMEIQRTSVLNDLVKSANSAYEAGDWAQAVNDYEKLRSVDQAYQSADVEERLFRSYLNAAEDVLADPDGGMEAFEAANAYYRMALALRPQNQEVLTAQSNARVNIEERMIASYLRDAVRVLSDQGDSLDALKEAEKYFSQALTIRPNDPNLSNQVNFARLYLTAIQDFEKGRWTDVINKLLPVYTEEPDYADGTARQGLYEAYIARGEAASAAGDYFTALNDYQQSAVLALESPDSLLRLFEAQLKIAETKGRLGDYEDAVRVYQAALEQINFDFRARQDNPTIARGLDSAANLANANNFRQAYLRYRETLANARDLFEYFTYDIQPGDYLASIARRFNTTLEALADANSIDNPNKILDLDKLVIPSLPPTEPEPTTEP